MNIIVGATGQVGSMLISEIKKYGFPVRAVVRNPTKLSDKTIETHTADLFNAEQLTEAFKGGTTAFLVTPENPATNDLIGDTKKIIENYRKAIEASGITRIVGLSSIGAHINAKTGNILQSRMLEQGFGTLHIEKIFVRPSYYFSNWLGYIETIKQDGVLPTFFPGDLQIEMVSPIDLAKFLAGLLTKQTDSESRKIYELVGPQTYSSTDVAKTFSSILEKEVFTQSIPQGKWKETLLSAVFTENTANNLIDMTQAVINNLTVPEFPNDTIKLPTTIDTYLKEQLKS